MCIFKIVGNVTLISKFGECAVTRTGAYHYWQMTLFYMLFVVQLRLFTFHSAHFLGLIREASCKKSPLVTLQSRGGSARFFCGRWDGSGIYSLLHWTHSFYVESVFPWHKCKPWRGLQGPPGLAPSWPPPAFLCTVPATLHVHWPSSSNTSSSFLP